MFQAPKIEKLRAIRDSYVRQKSRFESGMAMIDVPIRLVKLSVYGGLFVAGINMLLEKWGKEIRIPLEWVPLTVIIIIPVAWYLGYLNQTKIHLEQAETSYHTSQMNPHLRQVSDDTQFIRIWVKKIINKLKIK